ncbi:hypothetical protein MXB_2902 [Myxobolus squamalis]|nr:hypothetical protein MXB_2902 [Myxobolus squamalis]
MMLSTKIIAFNYFHALAVSSLTVFLFNNVVYHEKIFKYFLIITINLSLISMANPKISYDHIECIHNNKLTCWPYTLARYFIFFTSALSFLMMKNFCIPFISYTFTYHFKILEHKMITILECIVDSFYFNPMAIPIFIKMLFVTILYFKSHEKHI